MGFKSLHFLKIRCFLHGHILGLTNKLIGPRNLRKLPLHLLALGCILGIYRHQGLPLAGGHIERKPQISQVGHQRSPFGRLAFARIGQGNGFHGLGHFFQHLQRLLIDSRPSRSTKGPCRTSTGSNQGCFPIRRKKPENGILQIASRRKNTLKHLILLGVFVGCQPDTYELAGGSDHIFIGQETPVHALLTRSPDSRHRVALWRGGQKQNRLGGTLGLRQTTFPSAMPGNFPSFYR